MSTKPEALVPEENARRMSAGLFRALVKLCDEARINYSTACALLGISRARWTTIQKQVADGGDGPNLSTSVFLSLYRLTGAVQHGLQEGWLPATGTRGKAQEEIAEKLLRASKDQAAGT